MAKERTSWITANDQRYLQTTIIFTRGLTCYNSYIGNILSQHIQVQTLLRNQLINSAQRNTPVLRVSNFYIFFMYTFPLCLLRTSLLIFYIYFSLFNPMYSFPGCLSSIKCIHFLYVSPSFYWYLPVSCRSLVDRYGSLGSCNPQI